MNKRVTIYDIAEIVGTSRTSVHKALHGKEGISEETRRHILDVAEKHGYKVNMFAKSLSQQTKKIGVVFEQYNSPYLEFMLAGIKDEFEQIFDYKIEPVWGNFNPEICGKQVGEDIDYMLGEQVDGIILCPNMLDYGAAARKIKEYGAALITVANDIAEKKYRLCGVSNNAYIVGCVAAELLDMICGGEYAVITSYLDVSSQKRAVEGFGNTLSAVSSDSCFKVYEMKNDDDVSYEITGRIIKEMPDLKGIFVSSSPCVGVCRRLSEENLKNKITLVGVDIYDGIIPYIKSGVMKCTLFQNPYWQGKTAVRALFEYLMNGENPPEEIMVNPKIIIKSGLDAYKMDNINQF
jgi:LacI family transcriptional regulator